MKSGTSIGSNAEEAQEGQTKPDYLAEMAVSRKEARETKFFLRMVACAEPNLKPEARVLWQEAKELHLIFSSICRK